MLLAIQRRSCWAVGKNTAIFYVLTLRCPGSSAEHASLFPRLMQHIQSLLMEKNPVEWVLLVLPRRWVVKEIESNGRTAILSLPYRLFINLTICSDACLLLESVHTHTHFPHINPPAGGCSVQGWLTTSTFIFFMLHHSTKIHILSKRYLTCKWKSLKCLPPVWKKINIMQ